MSRPEGEGLQALAWREHAESQMRSARRCRDKLVAGRGTAITRVAMEDAVACARACRRFARELRKVVRS